MGSGICGTRLSPVGVWMLIGFGHALTCQKMLFWLSDFAFKFRLTNFNMLYSCDLLHTFKFYQYFQSTEPFPMTCPSRNPHRYSESTIWFFCPVCPKGCKSTTGSIQHMCARHG